MAGGQDNNGSGRYVFYHYHPSLPAAAVFVVLFGISTLLHIWQSFSKRAWFMIPFIIGGLFETTGYVGRILSSHDQWDLGPFIMQTLLLLVAPALFAASIYMVLGRIIHLTDGEPYSLIRRTWLTKIFVGGDVLSFLAQSAGGGLMSSGNDDPDEVKLGEHVILAGLLIQILFFGLFVVAALVFQLRGRSHLHKVMVPWKKYLIMLYITSAFILVRSIFRVVEYIQGNDGFLLRHEVFIYVFDAALMLGVMVIMNLIHPGDIATLLKEKDDRGSVIQMDRPITEDRAKAYGGQQQPYV
ncbi:RTA1 like protein-domain-containing protein [Lophiotrema nucula]|uniref:RTA1 like protein-domain-containing protein n=1 Tax=Lophiotrema nucula TaxID=690887 RepID=A0A6A5ZQU5_9PLEO|nr:RTA1 like protein-domain-containing protein [Lophiotrema nucula]